MAFAFDKKPELIKMSLKVAESTSLSDIQLSPDGQRVAFVINKIFRDLAFKHPGNIHVYDIVNRSRKLINHEPVGERSPILHANAIKRPTLLLHGQDYSVIPLSQSLELFRALEERNVPVEICVYPKQDDDFDDSSCQIDCWLQTINWFCKYMGDI